MIDVSVIIINFNTFQLTTNCITSVKHFTSGITYEIIVVDNASTEKDISLLLDEFPFIRIIKSPLNVGFAKGNNLGIIEAKGKYLLLLNSDTAMVENTLFKLLSHLEANPKVGVVSPRLIFPDGKHQSVAQRFPSIKYSLIELFRIQKLLPGGKAGRLLLGAFFDHRETVRVDWVWGACFMFPKFILGQLPGNKLDETYFMYFEDMQWCMDIQKLGYEIHFFADSEVIHLMGGSSGKKNAMMIENGNLFLRKNYRKWEIKWINELQNLLKL